jgi:hypothetical protein
VPECIFDQMRKSPRVMMVVPFEVRVQHTLGKLTCLRHFVYSFLSEMSSGMAHFCLFLKFQSVMKSTMLPKNHGVIERFGAPV